MYYHKITEYGIKCCMHAHHVAPRAPPGRGELCRRKTLFLAYFPIFYFYPNGTLTHPPTSKLFLDFWNFFNFAKPLSLCVFWLLLIRNRSTCLFHGKHTFLTEINKSLQNYNYSSLSIRSTLAVDLVDKTLPDGSTV